MNEQQKEIALLLNDAANGKANALGKFYEALLEAKLFYMPKIKKGAAQISAIGGSHIEEFGLETVVEANQEILPVFSEESFLREWNDDPNIIIKEIEFKKLIWLLGNKISLHLNPAQEVGKEISPWEIELLKSGKDSIGELLEEIEGSESKEIDLRSGPELFPELKVNLLPILEIYPELEEAFLITYREEENSKDQPVLGVKYNKLDPTKRAYLKTEFENVSQEFLPPEQQLSIIDDLDNPKSPNQKLFLDTTPFYIAQKASSKKPSGFFSKIKSLWK